MPSRIWTYAALLPLALQASCSTVAAERSHEPMIVLDSHLDTPMHFGRPGWDIMQRHSVGADLTQVDYPRMVEGGLDGGFWVIFTEQGPLTKAGYATARTGALQRLIEIREMVVGNERHFALATTSSDAARIVASGRRVVYLSLENAYPLGEDVSLLQTFHQLGVRMVGLAHVGDNQFADSATGDATRRWGGLSPLGSELVREANRLGVIVDAAHASAEALDQMIRQSATPVVISHAGVRALLDHPRNVDDERLKKLAASGGVIQLAAVDFFIAANPQREAAYVKYLERYGDVIHPSPSELAEQAHALADLDARFPPASSLDLFMQQLLHALKVAGVDSVGIGIDWDGGGGVPGLEDVSELPQIAARLRAAGCSQADIQKIMGGNLLRVLRQVEETASRLSQSAPATGS